jgi:rRNA biogenesis protein RRP5
MILEVNPRGLVVSLSHGLRGHVTPERASDVLCSLLKAQAKVEAADARAAQEGTSGTAGAPWLGGAPGVV